MEESSDATDQKTFDQVSKVLVWNKWLLSAVGLWPHSPNNFIFFITFSYFLYHMILEYMDLFLFIDNLEHVVENLTENMAFTEILMRLAMLKLYNRQLGEVITEALIDFNAKIYKTSDEKKVFINYMNKAKLITKIMCLVVAMTAVSHFLKPIMSPEAPNTEEEKNSEQPSFTLPYRFYIFYEIDNFKTYALTYASQFPFVFVSGFGQTAADCLMVTLVFHVSGKLGVLALRINAIESDSVTCKQQLTEIVIEHNRLLKMGKHIEQAFSETLLVHLLVATLAICMLSFQLLSNFMKGRNTDLATYIVFIFLVFLILYAICLVGESLITECENVRDAFYNCNWYEMPPESARTIVLCLNRAEKPLKLSAGKFKVYCLTTLTDIIKTAMAYLSVLRTFLVIE